MRQCLWQVDTVMIDLEDRDATVSFIHKKTLSEVWLKFRLAPAQLEEQALPLRKRIEVLAADLILDLGSFFDSLPD